LTRSRARLPHLQHGLQPVRHARGRHLSSALASARFGGHARARVAV
jgi:hypothetical protein